MGFCFFRSLETIGRSDDQEDRYSDDQKVDQGIDERSVIDRRRSGCLGVSQAGIGRIRQIDVQRTEIDSPKEETDGRHEDIVDEGRSDTAKRTSDDDGDGQIKNISSHQEIFEFLQHHDPPGRLSSCHVPADAFTRCRACRNRN